MTFPEFEKFQAQLHEQIVHMQNTKGKEYAHDADRFANFNRAAAKKGINRLTVAGILLDKHLDAIDSFILTGKEFSTEKIRGRFIDAILYLELMLGMVEEEQWRQNPVSPRKHQPMEWDPKDGGPR